MKGKKAKPVAVNVSEADYRREIASGVKPEEALRPGRHIFRRSSRNIPESAFEPRNTKIRVSIFLDSDVLKFFKKRAEAPNSAPYQTQINAALREFMEAGGIISSPDPALVERIERVEKWIHAYETGSRVTSRR